MPEDLETRTVMTPRTGTKICILIGLAFIVAAVYFYFVPATGVRTDSGAVFGCGTAANPSSSTFAKGTCWRVTDVEKYRAFAAAAIGVLTIVLGAVLFGVDRRTETRRARQTDGAADDRPERAEHGSDDATPDGRDDRDQPDDDRGRVSDKQSRLRRPERPRDDDRDGDDRDDDRPRRDWDDRGQDRSGSWRDPDNDRRDRSGSHARDDDKPRRPRPRREWDDDRD